MDQDAGNAGQPARLADQYAVLKEGVAGEVVRADPHQGVPKWSLYVRTDADGFLTPRQAMPLAPAGADRRQPCPPYTCHPRHGVMVLSCPYGVSGRLSIDDLAFGHSSIEVVDEDTDENLVIEETAERKMNSVAVWLKFRVPLAPDDIALMSHIALAH